MRCLLEEVEKTIQAFSLLADGQRVVVAVSGGLDSMVLLQVLHRLSSTHQWTLMVAHFNHLLRGQESHADQALVAAVAAGLGLPFLCDQGDVRADARARGLSIEMAARDQRHAFLARAAASQGGDAVALAHHADDQLELFFLRLLRGAGIDGVAGMERSQPSPSDPNVRLMRPLLGIPKGELECWASSNGIPFSNDATNDDLGCLRNRIRHELLPILRKNYQPELNQILRRFMELAREDAGYLEQVAASLEGDSGKLPFDRLHVAIQRRRLRVELIRLKINPEFERIEFLRLNQGVKLAVSPGLSVFRMHDGQLRLCELADEIKFLSEEIVLTLDRRSGCLDFAGAQIQWQIGPVTLEWKKGEGRERRIERFDAGRVGTSIVLRRWRPGDQFQPIGMESSVKLQNLFVNLKVPRKQRHERIVAVAENGEIFWVEGLRISERFKLGRSTQEQLQWVWSRPVDSPEIGCRGPRSEV